MALCAATKHLKRIVTVVVVAPPNASKMHLMLKQYFQHVTGHKFSKWHLAVLYFAIAPVNIVKM